MTRPLPAIAARTTTLVLGIPARLIGWLVAWRITWGQLGDMLRARGGRS